MIEINNLTTNLVDEDFLKKIAKIEFRGDSYLPQRGEKEIKKLVKEIINKVRAKEPKDYNPPTTRQGKNIYGKVMADLMP